MTRHERGAMAVELVIVVPLLMLILAITVGGGRMWYARSTVQQIAGSAARAATLAREPASAHAAAQEVIRADLAAAALPCVGGAAVMVDVAGFSAAVGQPASVGVRIGCTVPLADLLVPGWPGVVTVEGAATSPLDRYRGRR